MKFYVEMYFAVKYPRYGKLIFDKMDIDDANWLLDLIVSMLNNGIIEDYQMETTVL